MDNKSLKVKISSPEGVLWEGTAFAVSSKNSQGKFDILPHHTRFLTIIENQPLKISNQNRQVLQEFRFPQAVIYNQDNRVAIYTLGTSD